MKILLTAGEAEKAVVQHYASLLKVAPANLRVMSRGDSPKGYVLAIETTFPPISERAKAFDAAK